MLNTQGNLHSKVLPMRTSSRPFVVITLAGLISGFLFPITLRKADVSNGDLLQNLFSDHVLTGLLFSGGVGIALAFGFSFPYLVPLKRMPDSFVSLIRSFFLFILGTGLGSIVSAGFLFSNLNRGEWWLCLIAGAINVTTGLSATVSMASWTQLHRPLTKANDR
jgi:hypothetical protein